MYRQFWLVGSALSALSVFRFPLIIVTIIDNNFISLFIYLEEGEEKGGTVVVSPSDTQSQLQQKSLIFPSKPESLSPFWFRLSSREDWYWESMCGFCDIEVNHQPTPPPVKLVCKLKLKPQIWNLLVLWISHQPGEGWPHHQGIIILIAHFNKGGNISAQHSHN